MSELTATPEDIIAFWFPDGPNPEPKAHIEHWMWRMRGGAHEAVIARYSDLTRLAATGGLDHWAETSTGRMALIIILDQFSRSVFAGTPDAFAQDPKSVILVKEGLENGHYDALDTVWQKATFKLPLEHCECPEHLENLDLAVALAEAMIDDAPEQLRAGYVEGAKQPARHREVIRTFGRFPHRNEILGRPSTEDELSYVEKGDFPHTRDFSKDMDHLI